MALDALRCNHLAPLGFKGLTTAALMWISAIPWQKFTSKRSAMTHLITSTPSINIGAGVCGPVTVNVQVSRNSHFILRFPCTLCNCGVINYAHGAWRWQGRTDMILLIATKCYHSEGARAWMPSLAYGYNVCWVGSGHRVYFFGYVVRLAENELSALICFKRDRPTPKLDQSSYRFETM